MRHMEPILYFFVLLHRPYNYTQVFDKAISKLSKQKSKKIVFMMRYIHVIYFCIIIVNSNNSSYKVSVMHGKIYRGARDGNYPVAPPPSFYYFIKITSKSQNFFFKSDFHFNTSRKIQNKRNSSKSRLSISVSLQRFASIVHIHKVSRPLAPPSDWTCAFSGPSGP